MHYCIYIFHRNFYLDPEPLKHDVKPSKRKVRERERERMREIEKERWREEEREREKERERDCKTDIQFLQGS